MDAADLPLLDITPAALDRAPPWAPLRGTGADRLRSRPSCSYCGQPATATTAVEVPGAGLRWVDRCTPCLTATLHRPVAG